MLAVLASVAVVLVAAPGFGARFGRRVHPADWTRWSIGSLIAGAVALEAALVLFALPTVLRALGAHALVAACARMTGSLMPGGPIVGWSAAATAMASAFRFRSRPGPCSPFEPFACPLRVGCRDSERGGSPRRGGAVGLGRGVERRRVYALDCGVVGHA